MVFGGQVDQAVPFIYAHGGAVKERDDYSLTDLRTVEAVRWFADLALIHDVMPLPERLELYEPDEGGGTTIITTGGEGEQAEAEQRWGMIGVKADIAAQEGDAALWAGPLSERQGTGGWNWDFGSEGHPGPPLRRRVFADQIGDEAYDAGLATIEQATPVDYHLYFVAERYLGQPLLDILENGEEVEATLSRAQAALEVEP